MTRGKDAQVAGTSQGPPGTTRKLGRECGGPPAHWRDHGSAGLLDFRFWPPGTFVS